MVSISKTNSDNPAYLYINLLNFKDKEEQEKWFNIIKTLIENDLNKKLAKAFKNDKTHTERLSS